MIAEPDDAHTSSKQVHWEMREDRLQQLLLAGLSGAEQPYKVFLRELSCHLRGYFTKRMRFFLPDVEDLVQETLLSIHNKRHTYDRTQSLSAWVFAIARYKYVDYIRLSRKQHLPEEVFDEQSEIFAYEDHEAKDAQIDIEKLLCALPDRYKLPIVYTKLKGYSITEAAQLSGMTESAVKVGVHRGLKMLASRLRSKL